MSHRTIRKVRAPGAGGGIAGVGGALAAVGIAALLIAKPAPAQVMPAETGDAAYAPGEYRVFTGAGQAASLDDVVDGMGGVDVVFIGETHDDPTGHRIEADLLERASARYGTGGGDAALRAVALSLEFFERDVQPILDEYLAGLISESSFRDASRPWPRYETDYRPLIELSKERGLDVIAGNAPRRYVSRVTRLGRESLEDLPAAARRHLPPLPYGQPSDAYRSQWIRVIASVTEQEGTKCGLPVPEAEAVAPMGTHANMGNQMHSQVLWDASMAWWLSRYLEEHPGALVLHMVGGFHVAQGTGTPEHLAAYAPGARALVVLLRPVEDVERFEPAPEGEWGDFVIQTEGARTLEAIECRTYRAERGAEGPP